MVAWSIELSEFDIQYEPRAAIKAQAMTDFLEEMVNWEETRNLTWTLYINRASNSKGSGAGVILDKEGDIVVKLLLKSDFLVSNNQAEYQVLIAGLQLASDISAT